MKTRLFIAMTIFFIPPLVFGQGIQALNRQVQQGDVLVFRIAPQWQGPQVSVAVFGRHYLPNKFGEVYVGIDKNIAPGKHIATLVEYGRGVRLSWDYEEVEVAAREFPVRKGIPGKPRSPGEMRTIEEAYARGNRSEKYIDSEFIMPLDKLVIGGDRSVGDVFSPFGGEGHRGVDLITLDPGTGKHQRPVKAINSGRVVLARRLSLEGNVAIVDHGSGIFSLYMHLSKFNVRQGESVKTGQVIGTSGRTGRVTGPHLHFAVRVGDPTDPFKFPVVDPLAFIETMNRIF